MKNAQHELTGQLQTLLTTLHEQEQATTDPLAHWGKCIQHCLDSLGTYRRAIATEGFPDPAAEIHFFKHVKPAIVARCRYYQGVYQLHLDEWKGCRSREKERLVRELDAIGQVFERNKALWQYYRSGSTALDEVYFLRERNEWPLHPHIASFDDQFTTRCDGQLAELLGMELYMEYIDRRLQQLGDPASAPGRKEIPARIKCTASQSEVAELGKALYLIGFFGNVTQKQVMDHLQASWQVDLTHVHQIMNQNDDRKEPARFLVRLLDRYRRYLDERHS